MLTWVGKRPLRNVIAYPDLKCVGSEAYLRLATEIIQREKELKAS